MNWECSTNSRISIHFMKLITKSTRQGCKKIITIVSPYYLADLFEINKNSNRDASTQVKIQTQATSVETDLGRTWGI